MRNIEEKNTAGGDSFGRLIKKFPEEYREITRRLKPEQFNQIEEIRVKSENNIILTGAFGEVDTEIHVTCRGMTAIIEKLLDHSVYAHMEDLCRGYVTVEGGHRVGICGKAVMENGRIKTIKEVSSLNIRRSREVRGCADKLMKILFDEENRFISALIVSPPKCGKTTLLRDIIRQVSQRGLRVSLVDERSEIAAVYKGVAQHDIGKRTDVMDGCKKSEGINLMIRSMSPPVVCTDEIGSAEDVYAIKEAVTAGIGVLTTVHGSSMEELRLSKIGQLIDEKIFGRYIFMSGSPKTGTVAKILDREGHKIEF